MRIRKLNVTDIKALGELEWRVDTEKAGWHVILGNNGAGKSSLLKCFALALVGPREALSAREEWSSWIAEGKSKGEISVEIAPSPDFDKFSQKGNVGKEKYVFASLTVEKTEDGSATPKVTTNTKRLSPTRHIWGTGGGWFSAGYGPFRRFSGGDKDAERIFLSNPMMGAHISVFGENVALSESLFWLRELHYKSLENSEEEARTLDALKLFVNQDGFLPHDVRLEGVSSKGVDFKDAYGRTVSVEELSDGYRSILSMTFDLLRQLTDSFTIDQVFDVERTHIISPGVVLIDEVDAHLHPSWQKAIGFWLVKHFPNMQFVVTTHSPLICHAATTGSIFRLATPGTEEQSGFIEGVELDRIEYGDILESISTPAFGTPFTRSDESYKLEETLAELNVAELARRLTPDEKEEQKRLRSIFPIVSNSLVIQSHD